MISFYDDDDDDDGDMMMIRTSQMMFQLNKKVISPTMFRLNKKVIMKLTVEKQFTMPPQKGKQSYNHSQNI